MNCTNCGSEIKEDAKFCTVCGAVIAETETPVTEAPVVVAEPVYQAPNKPTKQENKIRAQKTGTSPGVFLNQNMCCASAPGYLAALIHHAVNSAAPSARAIFRTLAPSHRGCLRTARHLGSFSCRSSITFENLFVNVAYVHQRDLRIMDAAYHFFAIQCRRGRIKRRDREYRKCNAFG